MKENNQGFENGQHYTVTEEGVFKDIFTAKKGRKPTIEERREAVLGGRRPTKRKPQIRYE